MSVNLKALRDDRGKAIKEARALVSKAETEKRDMTADEQVQYDRLLASAEANAKKISDEERLLSAERDAAAVAADTDRAKPSQQASPEVKDKAARASFVEYLRRGVIGGDGASELRALQADNDIQGGFLIPPMSMVNDLIKNIDDEVFIRKLASKRVVNGAASLGIPTLEADPADADWTNELAIGSEDSSMSFGRRELHPHPLAKMIKVSEKLLRADSSVESLVLGRLGYKFGISEEKAFLTGTGAGQPLGVFTASASGVPTSQDVSTGNTTTSVTFDGLMEAKYKLKAQYQKKAVWIFHRDAVKQIAKLKDGEGQYIWKVSVRDGEPDTILGRPFYMSEYAPNTFTTGLYVGIFGDFSNYLIADALSVRIQRLVELYAATNQVGFIGRLETDGMPVLAEAFARVKLA